MSPEQGAQSGRPSNPRPEDARPDLERQARRITTRGVDSGRTRNREPTNRSPVRNAGAADLEFGGPVAGYQPRFEEAHVRAYLALTALTLSAFIYVTTETLPIGLLPQIAGDLHVAESSVGLLVTAYGFVVVVATFPLTRLSARWPRRRLIAVLLGVFVVAMAVSAAAPDYPVLLAARVATALSQAVFWAVVTPVAAALFPPAARGRALSILFAGGSLAVLGGTPFGTWLGQLAGWRVPFVVLAAVGVAAALAIVRLLPSHEARDGDTSRGTHPDVLRYRLLVVAVAVMVTGFYAGYTFISPFLTGVSGLAETAVAPILLLLGVTGLLGVFIGGRVAANRAWIAIMVVAGLMAVGLAAQSLAGPVAWAAIAAISVSSFALSSANVLMGTLVLRIAPGSTDIGAAGTSTAVNVGITAGALLGSASVASAGVRDLPLLGAGLALLAFGVAAAGPSLFGNNRRDTSTVESPRDESGDGRTSVGVRDR
jgi:MFS transporter, DHA1 family, inner membrane transport protein